MKPKKTSKQLIDRGEENKSHKSMLAAMFPGLSIPNEKQKVFGSEDGKENEHRDEHDDTVDNMMAALEAMAPSKKQYANFK
jgi:hypothetical protein